MIRQCCQCKRICVDGQWVYPRLYQLAGVEISHGYCEACFAATIQSIHDRERGKGSGWRRWWCVWRGKLNRGRNSILKIRPESKP
jgi:hypothetical protein